MKYIISLIGGRLSGAIVKAGKESDTSKNAACGLPVTMDQASIPGAHIDFVCDPPVIARYVSVDKKVRVISGLDSTLTLCEVMVEEYHKAACPQTKSKKSLWVTLHNFKPEHMGPLLNNHRLGQVPHEVNIAH